VVAESLVAFRCAALTIAALAYAGAAPESCAQSLAAGAKATALAAAPPVVSRSAMTTVRRESRCGTSAEAQLPEILGPRPSDAAPSLRAEIHPQLPRNWARALAASGGNSAGVDLKPLSDGAACGIAAAQRRKEEAQTFFPMPPGGGREPPRGQSATLVIARVRISTKRHRSHSSVG
jgi:hypothetical protein